MEKDFQYLLESLKRAARRINRHYFQLDVAGSEDPMYRERVYCYELYHQLRCVLGDNFLYKLDGEVDKATHPIIQQGLGAKKPDFIIHVPGKMDQNLVVIEVKPATVKVNELREDLKKLEGFLDKARYYHAIMLIYGDGEHELAQRIRDEIKNFPEECILLAWHSWARKKLEIVNR